MNEFLVSQRWLWVSKKKFLNEWVFGILTLVVGLKIYNKMCSVSLFDRVKLCVVTLNDKHWTGANEVCKAQTAHNYAKKYHK